MKRMKTFLIYILAIVGFFLFSELLINASLEAEYKKLGRRDDINQVVITQAESTMVNGIIKGIVINSEETPLNGKYLKFDFYSSRDILKGTKYIDISQLEKNQIQNIEMHFKLENVSYYKVSIVNEKTEQEIKLLPQDLNKTQIALATFLALIVF